MANLVPYICCKDAPRALEFYKTVFGAEETMRLAEPSGKIGHAELVINGSTLMLSDEYPDFDHLSPTRIGGTPVTLHLYVDDCDAVVARAVAAGATLTRPLRDEFYGDRTGTIQDPFGHVWSVSTKKEQLSAKEVERRYRELMAGVGSA